jgi:hypothetical protein
MCPLAGNDVLMDTLDNADKLKYHLVKKIICEQKGWDSSVGIATHYGLEGPGIESQWGQDFPHPSRLLYNGCRVFPGGKAARAWRSTPLLPSRPL